MYEIYGYPNGISIHALREEGDVIAHIKNGLMGGISIHALREEGDAVACVLPI